MNKFRVTGLALTVLLAMIVLFTACLDAAGGKSTGGGGTPTPQTYAITFGVDGTNGTLKATVGGSEINLGDKVEDGKTVTFTATPAAGYKVSFESDSTPPALHQSPLRRVGRVRTKHRLKLKRKLHRSNR